MGLSQMSLYLGINSVLKTVFLCNRPFQICRCVHDDNGIK